MATVKTQKVKTGGVAADQLRSFIERIERLNEEKEVLQNDIKEVFAEAKMNGFDTPAMRQILKLRKMDHSDRQEREAILDLYIRALGMNDSEPDEQED